MDSTDSDLYGLEKGTADKHKDYSMNTAYFMKRVFFVEIDDCFSNKISDILYMK